MNAHEPDDFHPMQVLCRIELTKPANDPHGTGICASLPRSTSPALLHAKFNGSSGLRPKTSNADARNLIVVLNGIGNIVFSIVAAERVDLCRCT
ncbi:MAG: hypothetical protein AAGA70_13850 [Pseudomonadota bacterium]